MKTMIVKVMMAAMMLTVTATVDAQRNESGSYRIMGNVALYDGKEIREADARTFVVLGHGYAKDRENVYLNGKMLPWVDPQSFSLKRGNGNHGHDTFRPNHGGGQNRPDNGWNGGNKRPNCNKGNKHFKKYIISNSEVFYAGKRLLGASSSSFKDLGYGYGKDAFDVYFLGKKISGASASSFRLLKDGYCKDAFDVYYFGEKVKGASASSFKVDQDGYAHDAFSTFYFGKEIR